MRCRRIRSVPLGGADLEVMVAAEDLPLRLDCRGVSAMLRVEHVHVIPRQTSRLVATSMPNTMGCDELGRTTGEEGMAQAIKLSMWTSALDTDVLS